jgi:hypothetical protein
MFYDCDEYRLPNFHSESVVITVLMLLRTSFNRGKVGLMFMLAWLMTCCDFFMKRFSVIFRAILLSCEEGSDINSREVATMGYRLSQNMNKSVVLSMAVTYLKMMSHLQLLASVSCVMLKSKKRVPCSCSFIRSVCWNIQILWDITSSVTYSNDGALMATKK